MKKIKVALVTAGHPYDVMAFLDVFRDFQDMDVYPQHRSQWLKETPDRRKNYDAIVFYDLCFLEPPAGLPEALEEITANGQGIVILHHALLSYPAWPLWSEWVGMRRRKYFPPGPKDQIIDIRISDKTHPITRGLQDWTLIDETYIMECDRADKEGNCILLETDHPKSLKTLAWTRTVGRNRIFCFQSGHDAKTFSDPTFREILGRGIRWTVRFLE